MAEFHFLRPLWLLALPLLALGLVALARRDRQAGPWERVCDAALLPYVVRPAGELRAGWQLALVGLSGLLAVVALAGPAWKKIPQPVFSDRNALVIALDLSLSMDATDVSPSRLGRAMFELQDILAARDAGRGETALLVYAGDAFVVTPLTDDTDTIGNLLKAVGSDLMPVSGSRTITALELAERMLAQTPAGKAHVLLVTDGVAYDTGTTVRRLRQDGIRTSVLAMGTEDGAPIPTGKGFVTDGSGQIVIPRVDFEKLEQIAQEGGGRMIRSRIGGDQVQDLARWLETEAAGDEGDARELEADQWREEGPWLVLLLLPLAALTFRRGVLAVAALAVCLHPDPLRAAEPTGDSPWRSPDQQAAALLEAGDAAAAARRFENPDWAAVAHYRDGNYAAAAGLLESRETSSAQYNRGNALARAGDFPAAIQAYDRALALNPLNEDARYNKALLEEQIQSEGQGGQDGSPTDQQQSAGQGQDSGDPGDPGDTDSQQPGQDDQRSADGEQEQSADEAGESGQQDGESPPTPSSAQAQDESSQATEQWLRRIPDDPGGLLRRKFYYQYQQRPQEWVNQDEEFW